MRVSILQSPLSKYTEKTYAFAFSGNLKYHMPAITMSRVENFGTMRPEECKHVIYEQLIPICEAAGILLSGYGNHQSPQSMCGVEEYQRHKEHMTLFSIESVQKAFNTVRSFYANSEFYFSPATSTEMTQTYKTIAREIKHGEFIVAMILQGFSAMFEGKESSVGCTFKCRLICYQGVHCY